MKNFHGGHVLSSKNKAGFKKKRFTKLKNSLNIKAICLNGHSEYFLIERVNKI
jgi:hypothetical protein